MAARRADRRAPRPRRGQLGRRRPRPRPPGRRGPRRPAASVAWEQGQVFRYERWIDSPRLMAGYPAGHQPAIDEVDAWLRQRYRVAFGAPALALYRNERDSVAFHRDRELRWLDDTVIAVLTFGAEAPVADQAAGRPALRPRRRCRRRSRLLAGERRPAGDGRGDPGRWLHAVPKVRGRCRTRISVQWRYTSRRGTRDTNPSVLRRRATSASAGRAHPGTIRLRVTAVR